jgi:syntaxin-binding protein 5
MSLFGNKAKADLQEADWSRSLKELAFYKVGHLRSYGTIGEIVCIAVDPVASLIAIGQ